LYDERDRTGCHLTGSPDIQRIEAVVKLGGSLLELPDLAERVRELVELVPGALWVVGGGAAADVVRDWDVRFSLGDERAHRLALGAMEFNARLLEELIPRFTRTNDHAEAARVVTNGGTPVVNALEWTSRRERHGAVPLPRSWDITSDSVAAWIARDLGANGLWIVKSTDPPGVDDDPDHPKLDPCFVEQSRGIPRLKWVNALRTTIREVEFRLALK
jgi:5-(aminomethyl)-3-furanmethanol phosphate kinase